MSEHSENTVQTAWDQWFDNQWDLTYCIDRAVNDQSKGKGDGFRVALYAAIVEHCAEAMRAFIPDVALDRAALTTDAQGVEA